MEKRESITDFSLLGGPLYRLGCRLGLVHDRTNTVALGIVLGAFPWFVLLALAPVEGLGHVLFSIGAIGRHVRLLVTIPPLFVWESFIDPRFTAFVRGIVRSQVVPATAHPALESEITRITRWKDAWLPEAFFLLVVVLLALTLLMHLAAAALLLLLLFKYPIGDLLAKFFENLSGLWVLPISALSNPFWSCRGIV